MRLRLGKVGALLVLAAPALLVGGCGDDDCPDGAERKEVCVQCGQVGGCAKMEMQCVQRCGDDDPCPSSAPYCSAGECLPVLGCF
jgi:hypothetical protein